jgi:hypothetical protein
LLCETGRTQMSFSARASGKNSALEAALAHQVRNGGAGVSETSKKLLDRLIAATMTSNAKAEDLHTLSETIAAKTGEREALQRNVSSIVDAAVRREAEAKLCVADAELKHLEAERRIVELEHEVEERKMQAVKTELETLSSEQVRCLEAVVANSRLAEEEHAKCVEAMEQAVGASARKSALTAEEKEHERTAGKLSQLAMAALALAAMLEKLAAALMSNPLTAAAAAGARAAAAVARATGAALSAASAVKKALSRGCAVSAAVQERYASEFLMSHQSAVASRDAFQATATRANAAATVRVRPM